MVYKYIINYLVLLVCQRKEMRMDMDKPHNRRVNYCQILDLLRLNDKPPG